MTKVNCTRSGCQDVFHAFLVEDAQYDGKLELPIIYPVTVKPNRLVSFSTALKTSDYDQWVHFYEDDVEFERVWNSPRKYLPILSRFNGVITPDFSLFRDMPLVQQQWNTYRGRALGHWWQSYGLKVIPNVRSADVRTYDFCCDGIARNGIIAVGSHGCLQFREERIYFQRGLEAIVERLSPATIVVYGAAPSYIFSPYTRNGIEILQFDSEFACARKAVNA